VHLSLVIVATNFVAEAVLAVLPKNLKNFNVDNIRVVKIIGGSLQ
jgi:chaperonin GroEL (HSP60 family)